MRLVIFSDLDGTLLDHATYSYAPAVPMLERIRKEAWPLVFVTSKTRAEVSELREEMGVDEPFIVENGAAAFFPARYDHLRLDDAVRVDGGRAVVFGRAYSEVREALVAFAADLGIEGFGDMSDERVAEITGLPTPQARLARRRDFTEPFLLEDASRLGDVRREAAERGLAVTTGGRLHHLIGAGQDKGRAVLRVARAFEEEHREPVTTIGLGDGPNDVPMLDAVHHAIVIPAPGRPPLDVSNADTTVASSPGPAGWSSALSGLILRLEASEAGS